MKSGRSHENAVTASRTSVSGVASPIRIWRKRLGSENSVVVSGGEEDNIGVQIWLARSIFVFSNKDCMYIL